MLQGLLPELQRMNVEVELAVGPGLTQEGEGPGWFARRGIPVHVVPHLVREVSPRSDLAAARALIRLLRQGGYDVVHSHTSKAGFLGRLAGRWVGVPAVYSPHGNFFFGYFDRIVGRLFTALERVAARWSARIIVPSGVERDAYLEHRVGQPEQYVTIPNAVNLSGWPLAAESSPGLGTRVCFVGRLEAVKGPQVLLEALPAVRDAIPRLHVCIVGDGSLRRELEARAKEQMPGVVRFEGHRERVADYLCESDVVAVPSLNEGFGLVALEALAVGRPVVASRVGGLVEVLDDGRMGRLVPPGDATALATALVGLLNDGETRRRLSAAGPRWVRQRYSVETMARRTLEVYGCVLGEGEPGMDVP